ncbi:MAG: M23 family metallopeptidase [Clostridia bacterium]|nr:M23 family metallopeptidase [Clostridia bacterium]
MKIKLKINHKLKKEKKNNETKNQVKEYKIHTENMAAKLTTAEDNVIKLEFAEKKRRAGYAIENQKAENLKENISNFFKNKNNLPKNYYRLFLAMLLLAISSVALVIKNYRFTDLEDFITYSLDGENVIQASSSIDTSDITNEAILEEETIKISNVSVVKPVQQEPIVEKLVFTKPMEGEISKIFSADKVIYSKTLELWKTHEGIDIKGDNGQNVVSIEKGKVEKVYEDSFLGFTVVIDHGQGYKSSYSNLSENIPVKQGQIVTKGEILGQISNTAIGEIKDDIHLHFTLMKDNQIIDPTYIMKN